MTVCSTQSAGRIERPVSENEEETDSGDEDEDDDNEEDLRTAIQLSLSLTEVFFCWLVDLLKSFTVLTALMRHLLYFVCFVV